MKSKLLLFICLLFSFQINGQQLISTSGASGKIAGMSISWSIGELAVISLEGTSHTLTQGFHQPNLTVSGILIPSQGASMEISAYPNPVVKSLKIEWDKEFSELLQIFVYTSKGQLVFTDRIARNSTQYILNMEFYEQGIYLLQLRTDSGIPLAKYKIVKN